MPVDFDGFEGDIQAGGDLFGRKPFFDKIDDLHFPLCQCINIGRIFFFVQQLFGDDVLDLVADIFIAVVDFEDSLDHFFLGGVFGHVAAGAHLEHLFGISGLRVHGYADDFRSGRDLPDPLGSFEAGKRGHIYIHQDDVGPFGPGEFYCLLCISAFAYDLESGVAIKNIAPGLPDQFVVISN